jgi:O-antigen ligase
MAQRSVYKYNPDWDREAVEVGNVHNGFFATLDALGVVGTIFYAIWNIRLLTRTFTVPRQPRDPAQITLRFLALYLAVLILFYWVGAYTVGTFLPQQFALAGVFLQLQRTIRAKDESISGDTKNSARVPSRLAVV